MICEVTSIFWAESGGDKIDTGSLNLFCEGKV